MVLTAWFGVIVIVAACWLLDRPPIVRQWFLTDFRPWCLDQWERIGVLGIAVSVLAAFYLMLAIHELGHVVAGLCVRFRLRSYRGRPAAGQPSVSDIALSRTGPGRKRRRRVEPHRERQAPLAWRGHGPGRAEPTYSTATCPAPVPVPTTAFSACFIAFSVVNGMNDLVPFESRLGVSDGRRIWMLLRQPETRRTLARAVAPRRPARRQRAAGIALRRFPRQSHRRAGRLGGHREGVCHCLLGGLSSARGR